MCVLMAFLSASVFASATWAGRHELDEVVKAIGQKNSRWSASHTSASKWSPEEKKKRLGSKYPVFTFTERKFSGTTSAPLPARLDWRNYNGNSYVTPVKEQGDCGACWAFAVAGALESKVLISQNTPGIPIDLSEQVLTSCSGAGNCDGGYINTASDFISNYGLPPEDCSPYTASDGSCVNGYPDWASKAYTVPGWSLVDPTVAAIKEALYNHGPLVALMAAHGDFLYYSSGIYSHAWGDFEGYHAALVVGYDDADQHFIVKSSWGTDWGEAGYFRVAYSEINSATVFGCWTIAYNSEIPPDFPIIDGIPRNASGSAVGGAETSGNSGSTAAAGQGTYTIYQEGVEAGSITDITKNAKGKYDISSDSVKAGKNTSPRLPLASSESGFGTREVAFKCETYVPAPGYELHYIHTTQCDGSQVIYGYFYNSCEFLQMSSGSWVDARTQGEIEAGCCPPGLPGCLNTGFMGSGSNGPGSGGPGNGPGSGGNGPGDGPGNGPGNGPGSGGYGGNGGNGGNGSGFYGANNDPNSPNICLNSAANITSGNLYFTQDVAGLTLTYNSIDPHEGPLGGKWTHDYNQRIIPLNDAGNIKLRSSDGNIVFFRLSNGVYYPDAFSGDTTQITKNTDGSYTQTAKNGVVHHYNSTGDLTSITDRNGNTTTLTYNGSDLTGITAPSGRTTAVAATGGLITSVTDPGGRIFNLGYTNGLLTSLSGPSGYAWQYSYDDAGRMLTKRDPAGNTVTYTYDTEGRLHQAIAPDGTRELTYTQTGTTTVTEKDGGLWTYQYDPTLSVKTQRTDPLGNVTRYTHDQKRNLTSATVPDGRVTEYAYDDRGNVTAVTVKDSLGVVASAASYEYNSMNLVTRFTDPRGAVTRYAYDANGNLTGVTRPHPDNPLADGPVTTFRHDAKGNVIAIKDPNGQQTGLETLFAYDPQTNDLLSVTDPLGHVWTFTYDAAGNRLSMTDPSTDPDPAHNTILYEYDDLNRLKKVTEPLGYITRYDYDYTTDLLTATDAASRQTRYNYDYRGKLTAITDALNHLTELRYGPSGCGSGCGGTEKLTAVIDALNRSTQFFYDPNGRLSLERDPQGREVAYPSYDTRGNVTEKVKADGHHITYGYDALNRLTSKRYSDNSLTEYRYDANGNMTYAGNVAIAYNFAHDTNNRLTGVTDSNGRTIQYGYDPAGNRTTVITPENRTISYGYDPARRMTSITSGSLTFGLGYDANGRRTSLTLPNGTTAAYTYDKNSNLTRVRHTGPGGATLADINYTYNNLNNRATRTDTSASATEPAGTDTLTYGTANELLNMNATTYGYDLDGNRAQKTEGENGTTYTYDDENRLIRVETTGGQVIMYAYDPFGRRIEKNVNGTVTRYLYDREDILLEYDATGNVTARYLHGPGIDQPLAVEKNGQMYYYHADGLGSIIALTDGTGAVVQTYRYDAFGNILSGTPIVAQPYAYTAREHDPETGLYFYRARHYDPVAGRFLQRDPIGFNGGDVNLYAYARNDSVNRIDPSGNVGIHGAIVGGIVGLIGGGLGGVMGGGGVTEIIAGGIMGGLGGALGGAFGVTYGLGAGLGAFAAAAAAVTTGANPGGVAGAAFGGAIGGAFATLPGLGILGIAEGTWMGTMWGTAYGMLGQAYYNYLRRPMPIQQCK